MILDKIISQEEPAYVTEAAKKAFKHNKQAALKEKLDELDNWDEDVNNWTDFQLEQLEPYMDDARDWVSRQGFYSQAEVLRMAKKLYDLDDSDDYDYYTINFPEIFGERENNPTGIANPADYMKFD